MKYTALLPDRMWKLLKNLLWARLQRPRHPHSPPLCLRLGPYLPQVVCTSASERAFSGLWDLTSSLLASFHPMKVRCSLWKPIELPLL
jgi:hypothetical protein